MVKKQHSKKPAIDMATRLFMIHSVLDRLAEEISEREDAQADDDANTLWLMGELVEECGMRHHNGEFVEAAQPAAEAQS